MGLFEHPGFMSYGGSFEVLHADWPVYPAGHGWQLALASLAVFPRNVWFQKIDDIDQCLLLVAHGVGPGFEPQNDSYDSRCFHVAAWKEDLLELHHRAVISGTSLVSAYESAMAVYETRSEWLVKSDKGFQKIDLPKPKPEDYEDFIGNPETELQIGTNGISVTIEGSQILRTLARPVNQLETAIKERVEPLLVISYHDAAVREASIILESRLRDLNKSSLYGQKLVEAYYDFLCSRNGNRSTAFFKILRGELRTIFKFVRNDYAHALRDVTESQCRTLLDRISRVFEMVNHVEDVEAKA